MNQKTKAGVAIGLFVAGLNSVLSSTNGLSDEIDVRVVWFLINVVVLTISSLLITEG